MTGYRHMPRTEPPPSGLRPMKDFDPSEPAILHDRVSDTIISWSGEEAVAFRRSRVERADGTSRGKASYLTVGETYSVGRRPRTRGRGSLNHCEHASNC